MSPTVLATRDPIARKRHRCDLCGRIIEPGEQYEAQGNVYDGRAYTYKTCAHCRTYASVIWADDDGWIADSGLDWCVGLDYEPDTLWKLRLKAQFRRQWTRKDGALMPVPRLVRCRVFTPRTSWLGDTYVVCAMRTLGVSYEPAVTR